MTYRVHFTLPDGSEDSVVLSGETPEDIRAQANVELAKRYAKDPWSEEVTA